MSKKQTSIEWLIEQLKEYDFSEEDDTYVIKIQSWVLTEKHEQAKAMHKEEIIESYCTGSLHMAEDETIFPRETSERYYETTFGDPPPPKPHIPFIYR